MSARTWTAGDPEPTDHPPVVDEDGVTWMWSDVLDEDYFTWTQMKVTQLTGLDGKPGLMSGYSTSSWPELLTDYGPVREATDDEARNLTVAYSAVVDA